MLTDSWLELMRCPQDGERLTRESGGLRCTQSHVLRLDEGIARMVCPRLSAGSDASWSRFYDRLAPLYDLSERLGGRLLLGLDMVAERAVIVRRLGLKQGMRLLEISCGPGVSQALLARAIGPEGELAELDLSLGMLRACSRRARRAGLAPLLVQANAAWLPFADGSFDAVFHFGGVKLFSEPERALGEMVRVAKPGAIVAWGDEGFDARGPSGWRRRLLARINPGFGVQRPPAPAGLLDIEEHEVMGGCAWLVVAKKERV